MIGPGPSPGPGPGPSPGPGQIWNKLNKCTQSVALLLVFIWNKKVFGKDHVLQVNFRELLEMG